MEAGERPGKQQQEDGHHLGDHLALAEGRRPDEDPPPRRHVPQRGHRQLAPQDDHHHPGGHQAHLHHREEGGGGEQLVREGVEEDPDPRDLVPSAREVAVEVVGEDGHPEDRDPEEEPAFGARPGQQDHHEDGHEEDPQPGQGVGQVQRLPLRSSGPSRKRSLAWRCACRPPAGHSPRSG